MTVTENLIFELIEKIKNPIPLKEINEKAKKHKYLNGISEIQLYRLIKKLGKENIIFVELKRDKKIHKFNKPVLFVSRFKKSDLD